MPAFVMLTRVSPELLSSPRSLENVEHQLMEAMKADYPQVKWLHSYAMLGAYDYLDVFQAPDNDTATKVSMLVRTFGKGSSEVWPATEWRNFKSMIERMPEHHLAAA